MTSATIPYYHTLLQFATPFNVACGAWSAIAVVSADSRCMRSQHPQPVDAETEPRGRIRFIEFSVLMYTQLAVINS